jgi:hypothetical protein
VSVDCGLIKLVGCIVAVQKVWELGSCSSEYKGC